MEGRNCGVPKCLIFLLARKGRVVHHNEHVSIANALNSLLFRQTNAQYINNKTCIIIRGLLEKYPTVFFYVNT